MAFLIRLDVLGARLDGRFHDLVFRADGGGIGDLAQPVEHEGHRAGFTKVAAALVEGGADRGGGAVAVVGQRLDDHAYAAGAEALVADVLEIVGVGALGLLDRPLDVVAGHGLGAGVVDRQAQARIGVRVRHALLGRQSDVPRQLGKQLGALLVLRALAELDVLEL